MLMSEFTKLYKCDHYIITKNLLDGFLKFGKLTDFRHRDSQKSVEMPILTFQNNGNQRILNIYKNLFHSCSKLCSDHLMQMSIKADNNCIAGCAIREYL